MRKELERAVRRSEKRDRKRRTKMKVSGKNVFRLAQVINQPKRKGR